MRKWVLCTAIAGLMAGTGRAYEVKDNPDRFISLGANYQGVFLKGTGTFDPVPGFFFNEEKDLKDTTNSGTLDLRVPMTENLTLSVGGGYASRDVDRIDASVVPVAGGVIVVGDKLHDKFSGPVVNIGARYYFK